MLFEEDKNPFKVKLIERLSLDPDKEEEIITELMNSCKDASLKDFFQILLHVELTEEEANEYFHKIIQHRVDLKDILGRDPGFRVSMLDFFTNIKIKLDNPSIMEMYLFELLAKYAMIDDLTLLFNRRYFTKILNTEFSRSKRHKLDFSIVFFDIDDFKKVNDEYGHQFGDLVLKKIGDCLISNIRREDVACRYGGEEFIVILPLTGKQGAFTLTERVREKIANIDFSEEKSGFSITVSGGIASFPEDTDTIDKLINIADKRMYIGKKIGKNVTVIDDDHKIKTK